MPVSFFPSCAIHIHTVYYMYCISFSIGSVGSCSLVQNFEPITLVWHKLSQIDFVPSLYPLSFSLSFLPLSLFPPSPSSPPSLPLGVHSGDATLVLPAQDLNKETVQKIRLITESISRALSVSGKYMYM